MSELKFKSSLSMEEIENNFESMDIYSCLMDSLEEALAYSRREETSLLIQEDHSLVDKLQCAHA